MKNTERRSGPAWLVIRKGIRIASLSGSGYEMGRQHAALLADELREVYGYYRRFLTIQAAHVLPEKAAAIVVRTAERLIMQRLARGLEPDDLAPLEGIAAESGLPRRDLVATVVAPDVFQYVIGRLYRSRLVSALPPSPLGCTSFAAGPGATGDGHMLVGHNKDYPGMGYWDRFPTLFLCTPDKGYRYAMAAGPAIHSASMASQNEHGLALAVHTFLTADVALAGLPLMAVGRRVMEEAKTVREAVAILSGRRTMVGWNFLVADASGDAASVETWAGGSAVRFQTGPAGCYTNVYRSPAGRQREIVPTPTVRANFENRAARMTQLLEQHAGRIGPRLGAAFLSDHLDLFTGRERGVGGVIAQNQDVMSVMFDCTTRRVWMADGLAPACCGVYRGFDLMAAFDGRFPPVPDYPSPMNGSDRYRAARLYVEAERAVGERHDPAGARTLLEQAAGLDQDEPLYPVFAGICACHAGDPAGAVGLLRRGLELPDLPDRVGHAQLWLARALDLAGDRAGARAGYAAIANDPGFDGRLHVAARRGLRRPFPKKKLAHFTADFWMGDTVEP